MITAWDVLQWIRIGEQIADTIESLLPLGFRYMITDANGNLVYLSPPVPR